MKKVVAPFLFCLLLLALFFPNVLFKGEAFFAPLSDFHLGNFCRIYYFQQMVRQGIFPLWDPHSLAGIPYGSHAASALNLNNLLSLLIPDVTWAWNTGVVLNVILAYAFTFLYLRKLGLSSFPSMVGGTLFAFVPGGGCYIDSFGFSIPLMLYLVELYQSTRRLRYVAALTLTASLLILSTVPQYSFFVFTFFILYVFFRFRSGLGIGVIFFSLGLTAFYLVRLFEFLTVSSRGQLWFVNVLLPVHLINFVFPFLFESPFRPETSFFFSKGFFELTRRLFQTDQIQYLQPPYVGVLGITLAGLAWKEKGIPRFYRNTVLFIVFYLMSFPLFAPIYRQVPVLAQLPRVQRLFPVFTFCLAVLAGWGASKSFSGGFNLKPLRRFYGWTIAAVLGFLSIFRVFIFANRAGIEEFLKNYILRNIAGNPVYTAPTDFYLKRITDFFSFIGQWTQLTSPSIFLPVLLILAMLGIFHLVSMKKIPKSVPCTAALLILAMDLFIYYRMTQYYGTPREAVRPVSKAVQYLQNDSSVFRIMTVMDDADFGEARERVFLAPSLNLLYGLDTVEGYEPLIPRRYATFFRSFQKNYDKDPAMILGGPEGDFDYRVLDFLNVKYLVTSNRKRLKRNLPLVAEDERNRVYLNQGYFPRAFLVRHYQVIPEEKKALDFLKSSGMNFRELVILEEEPTRFPRADRNPGVSEKVAIERRAPHDMVIRAETAENGFLVLTDNDYPGWKASLDGAPAKIYRANYSFRAVQIPPGSHVVKFFYQPASFWIGTGVSVFFFLIGIFALFRRPQEF